MSGIDMTAVNNVITDLVESFIGSQLAMFLVVVVVAFILGYLCISDNCQLTLPANTLSRLISMVNVGDAKVCIRGSQWTKKTNFEICIGPERKSIMKNWLETLWPSSDQEEMAVNHDPKSKESRIESPRSSASTKFHRSPIKSESEPKTSTSHVSRPKAWFRRLRDFVSSLLGKSPMGTSDPKPVHVLNESPSRPASQRSSSVNHSADSKDSSSEKPMKPDWLKSVSMNSLNGPNKGKSDSTSTKSLKSSSSKSASSNSLNEPNRLKSGSWIEQPVKSTISQLPTDPTQDQEIQNPDIWRPNYGPVEQEIMPVYGQHWNSFPTGTDRSRSKNCNKPIAITAVICVTLTVLLMSGLFALLKTNSEQLQQFGETLAQIYNRVF